GTPSPRTLEVAPPLRYSTVSASTLVTGRIMIRMKCPTCARAIGIDEAYVGKLALCPGCHTTFTVPAPAVLLDETAHPLVPPVPAVSLSALPLSPPTPPADPPDPSPG